MAKREFIEKEKVKKSLDEGWYRGIYPRNAIMCLHTFTEQDIVKPYLELLLKEMQSLEEINKSDGRYDKGFQHGRASCEAMVMHMIGNLLSEQGDTE